MIHPFSSHSEKKNQMGFRLCILQHLQSSWCISITPLSTKLSNNFMAPSCMLLPTSHSSQSFVWEVPTYIIYIYMFLFIYIYIPPWIVQGFGLKVETRNCISCHCKIQWMVPSAHGLWSFHLLEADMDMLWQWILEQHPPASAQANSLHNSASSSAYH